MPTRREFLTIAAGAGAAGLAPAGARGQAPAIVTAERLRPRVQGGVQVGDVTAERAIVWSRADRPAQMFVEVAPDASFAGAQRLAGPVALEHTAFTARVDLPRLSPGEMVFYRVRFESLAHPGALSEPVAGSFRSAPRDRRDLLLAWSGDTVGQGWGINPEFGGLRIYETMLRHEPDVFVHSGDMIYADNPLQPEVPLGDGTTWRNLVTPEKAHVAQTLDEFRGNYAYNLLDEHLRRFNAHVPMLAQWDDHEVVNNWYPGMSLEGDARYAEKDIDRLVARARRAMFDFVPFRAHPGEAERIYRAVAYGPLLDVIVLDERSYRGPNTHNRQPQAGPETAMLGRVQLEWLKERLRTTEATWKVIASGMPLGLLVRDGVKDGRPAFEAWANGEGQPLGRELELAELLSFIRREDIRNVVWITADVHYAAAHHYDPSRAAFTDFLPFWEFVAGPLHAGTFGPNDTDPTFGPRVVFHSVPPGMRPNRPPSEGLQFYGTLRIDGATARLAVSLYNLAGDRLYSVDLEPEGRQARAR
jgi:alkaline phosphatase D